MIFTALTTILAPLSILVIPGLAFLPRWHQKSSSMLWTLIALTSLSVTTIASFSGALLGVSQLLVFSLLAGATLVALILQYRQLLRITKWYRIVTPVVLFCLLLAAFSLPYLFVHDGLPTGDIQKSMIWASDVLETNNLPDYQRAIIDYNRDPVDFYTPGLHTLLAYVLALNNSPTTAGFFAIVVALAIVGISATLTQQLFPHLSTTLVISICTLLLLTNFRFLRYLREPGYHLQNSVGEFFLFGSILVAILLVRRWHWGQAMLLGGSLLALALVHQFSMFIALFALMPFGLALVWKYLRSRQSMLALAPAGIVLVILLVTGLSLGLHHKLPHLFTATPHLSDFTPAVQEYFSLLGPLWFTLGLSGLVLMVINNVRQRSSERGNLLFLGSALILLVLSQAPRLFIDIPPVRALFYSVVPLSIAGAYLIGHLPQLWRSQPLTRPASILLCLIVIASSYSSAATAFTLSHDVRTNSTFLPAQVALVDSLQHDTTSGGVLIDDYNRRSASWLIVSERPMFTRIAADLGIQMAESTQSPLRYQLYLNQLEYEKIFSLGSHPAAAEIMAKHTIGFVTGIAKSSNDAFAHNPALVASNSGGDIQLYAISTNYKTGVTNQEPDTTAWLTRTSTLVNDIGDPEDTFEHLPASIRVARLSDPLSTSQMTYRTTTAPYIPLQFNIGDYVRVLWDQDASGVADTTVELLVDFAEQPRESLVLRTSQGTTYPLSTTQSRLRIPASEVAIDERGFITVTLENPSGQLVSLDMIALGLAQIP